MKAQDPLDAWGQGRLAQMAIALREHDRGGVFGAVVEEREPGTARCRVGPHWFLNFGSADVLALDQKRFFRDALASAATVWGTGCGASRVYQDSSLCRELEHALAVCTGCQDSVLFNSVTTVHCGMLPSLARFGHVRLLLDTSVHNSVHRAGEIAAARGVTVGTFRHNDLDHLKHMLTTSNGVPIIAVDSVYSMSGEFAPVAELTELAAKANGYLYVDDAHGTGLYGQYGGGYVADVLGTVPEHVLVAGSLSKAACGYGGFLGIAIKMRQFIECASEGFLFNGPVPTPYLAADLEVARFLQTSEYADLQKKFRAAQAMLLATLVDAGLNPISAESHILAVPVGDTEALNMGRRLLAEGVLANVALFPAVKRGQGLVRFTPSVLHTEEDMQELSRALTRTQGF